MSSVFAVMVINKGDTTPSFCIVSSPDPISALNAASKACIDAGKPDTAMVAVFNRSELARLDYEMKRIEEENALEGKD